MIRLQVTRVNIDVKSVGSLGFLFRDLLLKMCLVGMNQLLFLFKFGGENLNQLVVHEDGFFV